MNDVAGTARRMLQAGKDRVQNIYERHGRYFPPIAFVGGFIWDSLTLRRIDQWFDNVILLAYLLLLGAMIAVVVLFEGGRLEHALLKKYEQWLPLPIQFFMGGLFSAYVVFYFKSAAVLNTWVFLALLVLMLIANEFLEHRLRSVYLLIPLYFLACFSFLTFFIPVAARVVSRATFIAAGLISLGVVTGLLVYFERRGVFESRRRFITLLGVVGGLYAVLHVFYLLNWIPPVPLAMKAGGVYHHASFDRKADRFELRFERRETWRFWKHESDPFHYAPGDTVFCFVSIFAPTGLQKDIVHEWQRFAPERRRWETVDRIPYRNPIIGKRDEGYRGVTFKRHMPGAGEWRVDVKTPEGLIIGRVEFELVPVAEPVRSFDVLHR